MPVIVRLFWNGGYARLTLDQVAAELGISKPTLYRALGDKDGVFSAALESYYRTYIRPGEDLLEQATTLRDALQGCFALNIDRMVDEDLPPGCFLTDTAISGQFTTGPIATTLDTLQERTLTLLHQRAGQAIAEGELDPSTDPESVVQYVLGQFAALSAVARSNPSRSGLEQLVGFMVAGLPWVSAP
ncbi:MAG: TetR/AcrR family transcriptional regulator [Actinomycetota bacterium]